MSAPPAIREQVLRLYQTDMRTSSIREITGVNPRTMARWAQQEGIPPRRAGGPRTYDNKFVDRAMALYRKNGSGRITATIIGCVPETVYLWARRRGISPEHPNRKQVYSRAQIASALRMYQQGHEVKEITEITGVSKCALRRHRIKAGIPNRE